MKINNFRGELTDELAKTKALLVGAHIECGNNKHKKEGSVHSVTCSASLIKMKYNIFLDTLIQKSFVKVMKINNNSGVT